MLRKTVSSTAVLPKSTNDDSSRTLGSSIVACSEGVPAAHRRRKQAPPGRPERRLLRRPREEAAHRRGL